MESKFINRDNLTFLNSQLSRELKLSDKTKDEKKEILGVLLGNMKKVYNKLDKSKITDKHLPKILDTFNKYSLQSTIQDVNSKQPKINRESNVGPMQYNRDREINQNRNVQYLDRPQHTYQPRESGFDLTSRNINYNSKPNIGSSSFDQSSRYDNNLAPEKAMERLLSERHTQVPGIERPPTPDFIKNSRQESSKPNIENFTQEPQMSNSFSSSQESNTANESKMQNDTYYLSGVNVDSNFSNINFGSNEITQGLPEIDESIDTNKRLEMLQQERSSMSTDNNNNNNNINNNNNSNMPVPDFTKSIKENEQIKKEQMERQQDQLRQQQMEQERMQQQMQQQQMQQQMYNQHLQNQQKIQQQNNMMNSASNINNSNIIDKLNNINQDDVYKLLNTYANNNSNQNKQINVPQQESQIPKQQQQINKQDDKISEYLSELGRKQVEQLKQVQILQEQLQNHVKNQMLNPNITQPMNNNNYQQQQYSESNDEIQSELISKVKILTGQLEQEKRVNLELRNRLDELMEDQNNDNDRKLELIENKKDEIKKEVIGLSTRHKEIESSYKNLLNKEKFVSALIDKNLNLIQADKKTIFVNSKTYGSNNKFTYKLDEPVINVTKVELISYDFPLTSNNINESNNKLYFKFDNLDKDKVVQENEEDSDSENIPIDDSDDIVVMTVPNGNYDISNLVKKLNKLGKTYDLIFSYNKNTSKVTIKSEISFSLYKKENNILNTLGYDNSNVLTNKNTYSGNLPFDLRKCNYIYIYFKNITDKEFAIVNVTTPKKGSYYLDTEMLNIENLDIEIKDELGNLIDFCNLSFKIELNLIYTNKSIRVDDDLNTKMSDSDSDNISINSNQIMETNI